MARDRSPTLLALVMLAACDGVSPDQMVVGASSPGADPKRGRALMAAYSCTACHQIEGVAGEAGQIGPPLDGFANRKYIAGQVPNQPDHLVRWIVDPQAIEPGTAMPRLGVTEAQARDMAAYLYTLDREREVTRVEWPSR